MLSIKILRKVLEVMANHIKNEFNRILSNPENEIVSESLIERLKPQINQNIFLLTFSEDIFESQLESFSKDENFLSISLVVSGEVVSKVLSNENFFISSKDSNISFSSQDSREISSFKIDGNSYILNITVNNGDKKE